MLTTKSRPGSSFSTPQAVAAALPKPADLVDAEERLAEHRRQREVIMDEVRRLSTEQTKDWTFGRERRIADLHKLREEAERVIKAARIARSEAMRPWAQEVSHALAPMAQAAARRLQAAVRELREALAAATEVSQLVDSLAPHAPPDAAVRGSGMSVAQIPQLNQHQLDLVHQWTAGVLNGEAVVRRPAK